MKEKKLIKTNEEFIMESGHPEGVPARFQCFRVTYEDEKGNHVLTHTIVKSRKSVSTVVVKKDKTLFGKNKIAFIKQFRSTSGEWHIEIPGGLINDGESEIEAANREVKEETGIIMNNVNIVIKSPSLLDPSKSDENFGLAYGEFVEQKRRKLDEDEQISKIIWIDEDEVFKRIDLQNYENVPFYDGLYMTASSVYFLMEYKRWSKYKKRNKIKKFLLLNEKN